MIHEDAEIITQERARDAKRPRRGHDKGLAEYKKHDGDDGIKRGGEDT